MRLLLTLVLLCSMSVSAQDGKHPKPYLDVYKSADSIYQKLINEGIDTILLYSLSRYPSELLPSTDGTNDLQCVYLIWQTRDSSFLQKINRFTIYQPESEWKYPWYNGPLSLPIIFDYYRFEKEDIDKARLYRLRVDSSNYDTNGKDTIYAIYGIPNCSDCKGYFLKYKIGDTTKSFKWSEAYYHQYQDDDPLYFVRTKFFTWLALIEKNIEHREKYRIWTGTKYRY